jgi:hypothetical protein
MWKGTERGLRKGKNKVIDIRVFACPDDRFLADIITTAFNAKQDILTDSSVVECWLLTYQSEVAAIAGLEISLPSM